jgi:esterase/lipase superfamily enzyme
MERRTFLCRTAAGVLGAASLGTAVGADTQFPQVSTRDHFGVDWLLQPRLQDGYGPREYDTNGTIPGYHTDSSPDELVVYIHRWLRTPETVDETFPRQQAAIEEAGFDGPVVNYAWDADTTELGWWIGVEYARMNGVKLAAFLTEYARRSPETRLRVIGYSLGAWMLASAAQSLDTWPEAPTLDSATFLAAAVPHDAVSLDGQYGPSLAASTAQVDNFWNPDDQILGINFRVAEQTKALGASGISGPAPSNYTDHRVEDIPSHGDYWKVEDGCIEAVVDTW